MEPITPPIDLYNISRKDLYDRIFNEINSNPDKYFTSWEMKDDMDKVVKLHMDSVWNPFIETRFVMWSIQHKKLDILLFIFRERPNVSVIMKNLVNYAKDPIFIEDFLNILNKKDRKKLATTTPLDILIKLPRTDDNCNEDLVDLYFEYLNIQKIELSELTKALDIAKDSHCPNLLSSILSNINQVKEEGYKNKELESIIKKYSKKEKM